MKIYQTVAEAKEHLPEITDRLKACKRLFKSCIFLLDDVMECCLEEDVDPNVDYGPWTSKMVYTILSNNQMRYMLEIQYLESLLRRMGEKPSE